jgi:HAD superfamily hydrolase (TIGR01549 family)
VSATITGVAFDLDGTLYTLRGMRRHMTVALWRSLGVLRHLSKARAAIRPRDFEDGDALRHAFLGELGRRAGVGPERASAWYEDEFLPAFVQTLARRGRRRPHVLGLLARLRMAGVRLAVVSDYPVVTERLRAVGIPIEAFHALSSAEESGALKPSPRALLRMAQRWGLDPAAMLVVGDREDLDGDAARKAGMDYLDVRIGWDTAMDVIATRTGTGVST